MGETIYCDRDDCKKKCKRKTNPLITPQSFKIELKKDCEYFLARDAK